MTQDYKVSVSMNQAAVIKTGLVLKQGDFGFNLKITVLDFDVTGTTPQIVFRKPMGAVESTDVTASGNVYTYVMKGTELDTPGKVICDLKLKNSTTQRISSASFQFECVADTLDGLSEETSSYSDTIEQIVGGFNDEIATIMEDIDEIQDVLADYNDVSLTFESGYYGKNTGILIQSDSGRKGALIQCSANEKYIISVNSISSPYRAYLIYDSEGTYITGSESGTSLSNVNFTVPENGAYIAINRDAVTGSKASLKKFEIFDRTLKDINDDLSSLSEIVTENVADIANLDSKADISEKSIQQLQDNVLVMQNISLNFTRNGYYGKNTGLTVLESSQESEACAYIEVEPGERYILTITQQANRRGYLLFDAQQAYVDGADINQSFTNKEILIPLGCRYLALNSSNGVASVVLKGQSEPSKTLGDVINQENDFEYLLGNYFSNAKHISKWETELMAHCSLFEPDLYKNDGTIYAVYYANEEIPDEGVYHADAKVYLTEFNICDPDKKTRYLVAECGETYSKEGGGTFTQSSGRAPCEPNLIVLEDIIYVFVNMQTSGDLCSYKIFPFNKSTKQFGSMIDCTLSGGGISGLFNRANIKDVYEAVKGTPVTTFTDTSGIEFTARIIYKDGYYFGYIGTSSVATDCRGLFVKSQDGIAWEVVSIPTTALQGVAESSFDFSGNIVHFLFRTGVNGDETIPGTGTVYIQYNMATNTWDTSTKKMITKCRVRPFVRKYRSEIYLIFPLSDVSNQSEAIQTSWGVVVRSTSMIAKVVNNNIVERKKIINQCGMNYISLIDYKGSLFLGYSTDTRKISITYECSDIAILPITLS